MGVDDTTKLDEYLIEETTKPKADDRTDTVSWRKLRPPRPWRPQEGEEIVGVFMGTTLRRSKYGEYHVAMLSVASEDGGQDPITVSGCSVIQALHGAHVSPGGLIRIQFTGYKELANGNRMRMMDVYVAEPVSISAARWLRSQMERA